MDFEPTYTAEQEAFRTEVQSWLSEYIPAGIQHPADSIDLTYEQYQLRRELGRRLGEQGWLWPTAPREYGGGGLTVDHSVVLEEEIDGHNLSLPPYYDSGGRGVEVSNEMNLGIQMGERKHLKPFPPNALHTACTEPFL